MTKNFSEFGILSLETFNIQAKASSKNRNYKPYSEIEFEL